MPSTVVAPLDVRYTAVTSGTSLRQLAPGDVLRFRAEYVGALKQAAQLMLSAVSFAHVLSFERYATSVGKYPATVASVTNGALRVLAVTEVQSDHNVAFFDVMVTTQVPPSMTLADLVHNIARDESSAEVTAVELLPRALAANDAQRNKSLQETAHHANQAGGANGGAGGSAAPAVVPSLPTPGFGSEFGKWAGIIVGAGALLALAYFVRSVRD